MRVFGEHAKGEGTRADGLMYRTAEKESGTDPRRDPVAWRGATADTTRAALALDLFALTWEE